jgi:hypothetical protein
MLRNWPSVISSFLGLMSFCYFQVRSIVSLEDLRLHIFLRLLPAILKGDLAVKFEIFNFLKLFDGTEFYILGGYLLFLLKMHAQLIFDATRFLASYCLMSFFLSMSIFLFNFGLKESFFFKFIDEGGRGGFCFGSFGQAAGYALASGIGLVPFLFQILLIVTQFVVCFFLLRLRDSLCVAILALLSDNSLEFHIFSGELYDVFAEILVLIVKPFEHDSYVFGLIRISQLRGCGCFCVGEISVPFFDSISCKHYKLSIYLSSLPSSSGLHCEWLPQKCTFLTVSTLSIFPAPFPL